jgi:ATP-binding cassette subfamily A (ABC1) protein 3
VTALNIVLVAFSSRSIFEYSSSSLLLVFLQLYSVSAIAFAYMIHTFFDKARTGAIAGALVFNCCYFVYASTFDISAGNIRPGGSIGVCVLSPAAFSFGVSLLAQYEEAGVGAQWSSLTEDVGAGIDLGSVFLILMFDTIAYSFLGWYLEQVLPKEFGVRQPYLFIFHKSYWVPGATDSWFDQSVPGIRDGSGGGGAAAPAGSLLDEGNHAAGPGDAAGGGINMEEVSADLRAQEKTNECVQIYGLRRVFDTPDGEKVAVKNLTVNIYANQIFALLGHNGAGKTTTINMLTGLYEHRGTRRSMG